MNGAERLFSYRGQIYPEYLKHGNACQFIAATALKFCEGRGYDVGCGAWPLPGAIPIDVKHGTDAMFLPSGEVDYVFSSHCLEHLANPIEALEHWIECLRPGGTLFLYLPSPEMEYWRPENCRKHLHIWTPAAMVSILRAIGLSGVINGERDLAWGFACVGFKHELAGILPKGTRSL